MAHYGSATAKRHYLYSNSARTHTLDRGKLIGWKRVAPEEQTAKRYKDRSGKNRFAGTSKLRDTQQLACKRR